MVALVASGFAVLRMLRPAEQPASGAADASSTQAAPDTDPATAALKALPCKPSDWHCWSKLPDGTPGKSAASAVAKSRAATAPPPQKGFVPQETTQQTPPLQAAPAQPNTQPGPHAAEQAARATEEQVAQLAALEHEELDQLSSDAKAVNVRVAALQKLQETQGQPPRSDVTATQQHLQRDLELADSALRKADVQGAQKYMDQANAEMAKLKKFLGP